MTDIRKQEILKTLREQENILFKIFEEREKLRKECKTEGIYNEIWEKLFEDGEKHIEF